MKFGTLVAAGLAWIGAFAPASRAADCTNTSVGLVPINDLGVGLYLGQFEGGLYSGGFNNPPSAHEAEGLVRAAAVQPLDLNGNPSPSGRIALLSVGMSNTTQEFCGSSNLSQPCASWSFAGQAAVDPQVNHATLVIVNGAMGGQTAATWDSPLDANYDRVRDTLLVPQGLSEAQVQVAWVKVADAQPSVSLPAANSDAYVLESLTGSVMRALKSRYPNIQIAFVSSRIYAGYARNTSTLNPEPYAYESGFAMKWLIQAQVDQMAGGGVDPRAGNLDYTAAAPWIAWGPYLWADGLMPRSDGLTWQCGDLENDGTHPAQPGEQKVGSMLLDFMLTSPFASPWFRSGTGPIGDGDCDDDGDVDLVDWNRGAECLAGPGVAPDTADCECVDADGDGDIDLADAASFQAAFTVASADPAFDDFEREALGPDWQVLAGSPSILDASDLGVLGTGLNIVGWRGSEFAPDQFCEATLSAGFNHANDLEVNVRTNLATRARYGFLRISATGQFQLKYDGISPGVPLAAGPGPVLAPGDTMRVEVQGTLIRGLVNGVVILTASDENLTAGAASLAMVPRAGVPAVYFESWRGGSLP